MLTPLLEMRHFINKNNEFIKQLIDFFKHLKKFLSKIECLSFKIYFFLNPLNVV